MYLEGVAAFPRLCLVVGGRPQRGFVRALAHELSRWRKSRGGAWESSIPRVAYPRKIEMGLIQACVCTLAEEWHRQMRAKSEFVAWEARSVRKTPRFWTDTN
jgi:hypothetical protein